MNTVSGLSNSLTSTPAVGSKTDLRDVDVNDFLTLMITELQNQDPLNPLDNAQMLQQISQIRQIGATNQLTDALDAMFIGQNLTTASAMIGKRVAALSNDGRNVEGIVNRVTIDVDQQDDAKRTINVLVGDQKVQLKNVREIVDANSSVSNRAAGT
jgi:flagellar basal-body rod modification protein FlgD